MRIYKKFLIAILCGGLMIISGAGKVSAKEDGNLRKQGGDFLVYIAKAAYERGQYQDAAHEFSKALLIDPENQEALKGLQDMGIDRGLYADVRTSLTNTVEISRNFKLQEVAEQTILNDSAQRRKAQFLEKDSADSVKQDQLGNVNKEIEKEIKALQKDIAMSRKKVAKENVSEAIKKAEKSMEKADMTVAEELLVPTQPAWKEAEKSEKTAEKIILAQAQETPAVAIEETIQMPVKEKNANVLTAATRKVESVVKETIQRPDEEKSLNILKVAEEKTKGQEQQIALAYDEQVRQRGKNLEELFPNQKQEQEREVSKFSDEKMEQSAQEALVYDKDLKAILAEQNRLRQELFEQEQYNRKMFSVLEDYLYAHRDFAKGAVTQKIMTEMDLANAQSALLDRHDELNRLYKDLDYYLARNYEKDDVIDEKNEDIMYFQNQLRNNPDTRLLWEKLEESQKNILEKRQKIKELEERSKIITVQ